MMNNVAVNPDLEHEYLTYYSKLSIALGSAMSILAIDDVFELSGQDGIVSWVYFIVAVLTAILVMYYLFAGNKFSQISFSKNAWTGTYNDEFLNTINLIAYKFAFFAVMFVASAAAFGGSFVDTIRVEVIGTFALAVGFIVYGVCALIQLRDIDE